MTVQQVARGNRTQHRIHLIVNATTQCRGRASTVWYCMTFVVLLLACLSPETFAQYAASEAPSASPRPTPSAQSLSSLQPTSTQVPPSSSLQPFTAAIPLSSSVQPSATTLPQGSSLRPSSTTETLSASPVSQSSTQPSSQSSALPFYALSVQPSQLTEVPSSSGSTSLPTVITTSLSTSQPSEETSSEPTVQSSQAVSVFPSPSPTLTASDSPTESPSLLPTKGPTKNPSYTPTPKPSPVPSVMPTLVQSNNPSAAPTAAPTMSRQPSSSPSSQPSLSPTPRPSRFPSLQPSSSPTGRPSSVPTSMPSRTLQEFVVGADMDFDDCQKLSSSSSRRWEDVTETYIKSEFIDTTGDSMMQLKVWATLKSQFVPGSGSQNATTLTAIKTVSPAPSIAPNNSSTRNLMSFQPNQNLHFIGLVQRNLQVAKSPLRIAFQVYIEFRSATTYTRKNMETFIAGAFNSNEELTTYIATLQQTTDSAFSQINKVVVSMNGVPVDIVSSENKNESSSGKGFNVWLVIGPVLGAFVSVATIGCFVFQRRSKHLKDSHYEDRNESARGSSFVEIECDDDNQDVSTLGDPGFQPGAMFGEQVEKDDTATQSQVSADYDWAMAYRGAGDQSSISSAGGTKSAKGTVRPQAEDPSISDYSARLSNTSRSDMEALENDQVSVFTDDASFERQYNEGEERIEIVAPAGKLGVVVDTPQGGVPVVHAIKESSVLADKIRVGDRLISVDGEDTTNMSAMKVSRLISSKAANPSRVLVFLRPQVGE